ncbi:fluoride efflux transporter FluC [Micromonospora cathayae]|uniref:Fluoride-specific ion channel FluC n=1 Tax=Micromonospora cathayae TaxID=3028804 RepID=A0ABY7ZLK5_9ACTN|nr:CrcB family protein [Micromonospora sp. HUAS 3]WDZ82973.1 CrcB family protein [Micromonospora sp. HUAS 3]
MADSPRTDPDVDLRQPGDRVELRARPATTLVVIAGGGVLGTLARFGAQTALPHRPTGFPWATFGVNVLGCLLIGVLMVLLTRVWVGRPLLRPFLGVGVLGGFTTFSAYVLDVEQAVRAGVPATALAYLTGTVLAALGAVWAGETVTGWLLDRAGVGRVAG